MFVAAVPVHALRERQTYLLELGYIVGSIQVREQVQPISIPLHAASDPVSVPVVSSTPSPDTTVEPTFSTGIDWACVSIAETGGDFTMHGPSYSSAYGVMDEAVRENAPADVAARILAGTATAGEQLQMAESVAAKHGFGAWASSTVDKCSR